MLFRNTKDTKMARAASRFLTKQIYSQRITVNSEAAASFHDDGVVILETGKGRLFSSNQTGALIWRSIDQGLTLEAIAEKISQEYAISRTTALEHTAQFVAELERHSLIRREVKS